MWEYCCSFAHTRPVHFFKHDPYCVCTYHVPCFYCFFSDTWGHHRHIFFIAEILANVVIFTWVSRCLSIHRNFSDSTILVNGTKNPITHQELGDVFEYCFWPGDCKAPVTTLRWHVSKIQIGKVSTLGEINSNNRGVLIEVSEAISKVKGTCRNIQRPGGDVFSEFFLLLLCYFPLSSRRNEKSQK